MSLVSFDGIPCSAAHCLVCDDVLISFEFASNGLVELLVFVSMDSCLHSSHRRTSMGRMLNAVSLVGGLRAMVRKSGAQVW